MADATAPPPGTAILYTRLETQTGRGLTACYLNRKSYNHYWPGLTNSPSTTLRTSYLRARMCMRNRSMPVRPGEVVLLGMMLLLSNKLLLGTMLRVRRCMWDSFIHVCPRMRYVSAGCYFSSFGYFSVGCNFSARCYFPAGCFVWAGFSFYVCRI